MFRTLIIVAVIILVFLLVKKLRGSQSAQVRSRTKDDATASNTVKCLVCNTYVPANEAIESRGDYFCCRQHQRDWQDKQSRKD